MPRAQFVCIPGQIASYSSALYLIADGVMVLQGTDLPGHTGSSGFYWFLKQWCMAYFIYALKEMSWEPTSCFLHSSIVILLLLSFRQFHCLLIRIDVYHSPGIKWRQAYYCCHLKLTFLFTCSMQWGWHQKRSRTSSLGLCTTLSHASGWKQTYR